MNGNFENMLDEVTQINEEIKRRWKTNTSKVYTDSLDEALAYMKKITEKCSGIMQKYSGEKFSDEETLSGFSFD